MISEGLIYFAIFVVAAIPVALLAIVIVLVLLVRRRLGTGPALIFGLLGVAVLTIPLGSLWYSSFDLLHLISCWAGPQHCL
jgi:hypothetical protein